ncbi:TonB-dependent receptor [Ferruginibacter albus]|uniref:TonB-dependent receptor n=1 Tax=Ferruginibacter albus TaxID=2875540 RepID=UPI001CC3CF88|nr:TonB-dependent receptor [Ferruginibacter albus]UAY52718.1 TonB-dependent receptor [Ferruginibacter albus]
MKKLLLLLVVTIATATGYSQNSIKGKITDKETGAPLQGATVIVTGTKTSTQTIANGEFDINSENDIRSITISNIGYEPQELTITKKTDFINIELASTVTNLSSVTVTGYETNRKLSETAGSIGLLKAADIQRGNNIDILSAVNTVPGVKMETAAQGDFRISIRGSVISDPWGIRNVKLYWNDIPLSSPDGTASHGVDVDPVMLGSIEILKGPSASLYGSGNGGVILFKSDKAAYGQNELETGYTGGSYGLSRFTTTYKTAGSNFNVAANVVSQRYDGYRENEWAKKDAVNIFAQVFPDEKRTVNFLVNHATGGFGIAGALDSAELAQDPKKAVQFCKDNKTSVKKYDYTILGVSQVYRFSDKFQNTTGAYGSFQTLDHPYGESVSYNGYLKESTGGYGARTKFVFSPAFGNVKARFTLGDEYQYQHQFDNTFQITNDSAGTWPETGKLTQNMIMMSTSNIIFAQADFDLPHKIFLTLGASYNKLSYDITDLLQDSGHTNYTGTIDFAAKLSPRIGLVKQINENLAAHASISYGYSPPPSWEINNFDGTLNTTIKPEDGVNYEVGVRGSLLKDKLSYDISAYQLLLTNAIVPVATQYGTTSYRNAGSTDQKGIEALLSYIFTNDKRKNISLLKPWISITANNYKFKTYQVETFDWNTYSVVKADNSGKDVTGVIPFTFVAGVDLEMKQGVYFNIVYYSYAKAPMNDANTAYSNAYSLLNAKLGYKKSIGRFGIDVFAGVNNALDTKYSSLISLNADANGTPAAWYNPSPGINYYGGIKLKYNFIK